MNLNIELKDDIDGTVTRDSRVSSNQIKTRQSSFRALVGRWQKFRIARLNQKLENMKADLVTTPFAATSTGLTAGAERKLDRKTTAIARVEEKIIILSKESVPQSYVHHRAIKLREKMMRNLVYNSGSAYSVGIANYDKVFAPEVPTPVINPTPVTSMAPAPAVMAASANAINVEQINGQNIASEVDKAMQYQAPAVTVVQEQQPIARQDIQNVVDNAYANVVAPVPPVVTAAPEQQPVTRQDIQNAVDSAYAKVVAPVPPVVTAVSEQQPVTRQDIQSAVDSAYAEVKTPETPVVTAVQEQPEQQPVARQDIRDAVEDAYANISIPEVPKTEGEEPVIIEESPIDRDVIQDVVNNSLEGIHEDSAPPQEVTDTSQAVVMDDSSPIDKETIKQSVDEELDKIQRDKVVEISPEEVEQAVGEKIPERPSFDDSGLKQAVESAVEGVKVGNIYDDPPRKREEYNYVPMTDEEIAQARENIEYEKYQEIYANQWKNVLAGIRKSDYFSERRDASSPFVEEKASEDSFVRDDQPVRDDIVVTPERREPVEEVKEDTSRVLDDTPVKQDIAQPVQPNEGIHFDYTQATREDVERATSYESSVPGLEALKARVLKLKADHEKSEKDLVAAREEQTDEARKAMEIREASRVKKQGYEESIHRLQEYCAALEEQTKENESSAAIARNDTAVNRRFIENQEAEMLELDAKIEEITSIISTVSDETKRR